MLGQLECDYVTISVYYTYDIILQITYSTSETNVVMKVKQKRFLILTLLHPLSSMLFLLSVIPTITSNCLPVNSECSNIIVELNKNKQEKKKMEKRKVETKKTKPKSKKKREGRLTRD